MTAGMTGAQSGYESYLLRLWCTGSGTERTWHLMLENPHTGDRDVFFSLEAPVAHLSARIEQTGEHPGHTKLDRMGYGRTDPPTDRLGRNSVE